jgi:uroporphyrinogen decarboxylase
MDTVSGNTLRAIRFERPEHIPVVFWINPACRHHYPRSFLLELVDEHRILFGESGRESETVPELEPWERGGEPYTDSWGCIWETTDDGITGSVTGHPLSDWDAFEQFAAPDPARTNGMKTVDWSAIARDVSRARSRGEHCVGSLEHGHAFLRLSHLRGYENVILDMADGDIRLGRLIDMVETFSLEIVRRYLELGVEMMCYPEDLGMQRGPMLSPDHFRRYIKPLYERLIEPARKKGCLVHMHSDGDIRDLADELVSGGVDALNLQDLVNGIDWIRANLKGRVCVDLDIDRQKITRFGSPVQIEELIRSEVEELGSPEGGLMMIYGLYPGVPLENVRALADAMERYADYYS